MKPFILVILVFFFFPESAIAANGSISEATEACLGCHSLSTPGIVADWKNGRHSRVTPQEALVKPSWSGGFQRRRSTKNWGKPL